MGFYDRFELMELVRDDGVKTFKAREVATGRAVEAHLFVNPYAPLSVALLGRIEQLQPPESDRIVDRGRHEGTPYVVTEPLTGHAGFREWVTAKRGVHKAAAEGPTSAPPEVMDHAGAWQVRPSGPPSVISVPPPVAPVGGVDEQFASLFHTAPRPGQHPAPKASPPPAPTPAAPEPPVYTHTLEMPILQEVPQEVATQEIPPAEPPAHNPPGAFTQLFTTQRPVPQTPWQLPTPPAPTAENPPGEFTQLFAAQKPAEPTAAPPSVPENPPGEFTQLFAAQHPTAAPATPEPAPPANQPGEFTQLFAAQKTTQHNPVYTGAQPVVEPPSAPANQPGEFTQLFAAQKTTQHNPVYTGAQPVVEPPSAPANQPGEFTQLLAAASQPVPLAAPQAVPVLSPTPAPEPEPQAGTQPGEFTRMLQAQPPAPAPNPQKAAWRPNQLTPANPPSGSQPGEFTRFFQTPIGPMPQSPVLQQPLQPLAPAGTKGGEFTQRFGQADIPQPPPPTPVAAPQVSGNATQGFSVPVAGYPGYPAQAPAPNYYDPYNPYGLKGPSEFTQKFAAPAQLTLGQETPDPAPPTRMSRIRPYLPLIFGIVGLLLIVVIVILIFARHK